MLRNPGYWRDYYPGDSDEVRLSRLYGYSDRCRYYWHEPEVQAEINVLIENLTANPPVASIISQYLPIEYEAIRAGMLSASPSEIIRHHIGNVLKKYASACGVDLSLQSSLDSTR